MLDERIRMSVQTRCRAHEAVDTLQEQESQCVHHASKCGSDMTQGKIRQQHRSELAEITENKIRQPLRTSSEAREDIKRFKSLNQKTIAA